jgi:uncharacterized protein (TIGR00255 family)
MIRSMTGYSRVRTEEGSFALAVSVKSTNHRFLDLQVRLPSGLEPCEVPLRRLVKERVARGHVEVQVALEKTRTEEVQLDPKTLDTYLTAWRKLREEFGAGAEPDLVALLKVPGMLGAGNGEMSPADLEEKQEAILRLAGEALDRLNEMRGREGEALERDLKARLQRLGELCQSVTDLACKAPSLYGRRLEKRVQEILGSVELDPGRLAQEVAFLASRSDIEEELTRFRSHLDQADRLIRGSSEVGKKLDFLLQEMKREANTLLSKTTDIPDIGLEIGRQAIEMKAEIEKLREQAQNVE